MSEDFRIAHGWLTSLRAGVVELDRDWRGRGLPWLDLRSPGEIVAVRKLPAWEFGLESGYFVEGGEIVFVLDPGHYPWLGERGAGVLLAGDFNDWKPWEEPDLWELRETSFAGNAVFAAAFTNKKRFLKAGLEFKFVTREREWLSPPDNAPNLMENEWWNANLTIDPERTGHHRFSFETSEPVDLSREIFICWDVGSPCEVSRAFRLRPGDFFYQLGSDLPLGAVVGDGKTTFRVFAPRVRRVEVRFFRSLAAGSPVQHLELRRNPDGTWEGTVERDLQNWFYWLFLEGSHNEASWEPVVDPYALALVQREGPGIVLDREALRRAGREVFRIPEWQDLVIAEIHVRDAVAASPVSLSEEERRGFSGMRKWLRAKGNYLRELGVNAVELQPVQEFDNATREEYHWGYMPVNFFSPASAYGRNPEKASQVAEFQELVAEFHRQEMAVILDVVYNHVGLPNHLMRIDKRYYFEEDASGRLTNWSGCGNDLRASAAMARRLIVDSLVHLVEVYDVDGFRFDLAELLGVETLLEIERRLKEVKPGVILIAEPWSFRGHIGRQLRGTGYSSWNDAFRDFMPKFVRGHGNHDAIRFFLTGSPGALASWPAQTVNYTESHDDRTWIDVITENPENNGFAPTENDRRRTRLMAAFLFGAIGIPMVAAGQDFLRSKHGVNNTYLRGDLNALDYGRLEEFRGSHEYFAGWIRFRRSEAGALLRLRERPGAGYFDFRFADRANAFAVVFNADGSRGAERLMLAINPHEAEHAVELGDAGAGEWVRVADEERFFGDSANGEPGFRDGDRVVLGALSCGVWRKEG